VERIGYRRAKGKGVCESQLHWVAIEESAHI